MLRELFISNFGIKIYGLKINNNILYFNNILRFIFYFIPFSIFNNNIFYDIIYKKDNIFYITNLNKYRILPLILEFIFYDDNNNSINMTKEIKYYSASIPIKFFIEYNNLYDYTKLNIKYIFKGTTNLKEIDNIYNYYDKRLYEFF
jgi:hypothetical protein